MYTMPDFMVFITWHQQKSVGVVSKPGTAIKEFFNKSNGPFGTMWPNKFTNFQQVGFGRVGYNNLHDSQRFRNSSRTVPISWVRPAPASAIPLVIAASSAFNRGWM